MPPLASAVEPEQTVSRSSTITGPTPSRARWYAVLTPMMPAPTMTTSAVCVTPAPYAKREPGSTDGLNRHSKTAIMARAPRDDPSARGFRHMTTIDPVWATVAELSHAFETRTLSPVDVVDALLARIRRRDPALHAYIALYDADAR